MRRRDLIVGVGVAALAACGGDKKPAPATGPAPLAATAFFRIDTPPRSPCARNATCEVQLVLTALGDFHVNADYPIKFIADPGSGVDVRGTGTFMLETAKRGSLLVLVRSSMPGTARVTGTVKLSVCTDDECKIEAPAIAFDVPTE